MLLWIFVNVKIQSIGLDLNWKFLRAKKQSDETLKLLEVSH